MGTAPAHAGEWRRLEGNCVGQPTEQWATSWGSRGDIVELEVNGVIRNYYMMRILISNRAYAVGVDAPRPPVMPDHFYGLTEPIKNNPPGNTHESYKALIEQEDNEWIECTHLSFNLGEAKQNEQISCGKPDTPGTRRTPRGRDREGTPGGVVEPYTNGFLATWTFMTVCWVMS